ncbi:MAG: FAD-dependent oxidoreductase [Actinomycetota bacterium]
MDTVDTNALPVAVIGAGPVGLAAAAHLHERGIPFVVFEVGDDIAASVRDWAHVQLFSPWGFNIDGAARRLLEAHGWVAPEPGDYPTGAEFIDRYLAPLALVPGIAVGVRSGRLVTGITRAGYDKLRTDGRERAPFLITTESIGGVERTPARAVIDATGTWLRPNPIGAGGRPAVGEGRAGDRIVHGIPDVDGIDRLHYTGRRVAVVGSGHSAQNAIRDLARLARRTPGTEVTWILRRAQVGQMFGGKADDQLPERGRLGADAHALVSSGDIRLITGFRTAEVRASEGGTFLVDEDGRTIGPFDQIVGATGFRPDMGFLSELRLDVDPVLESARALAPLIDPNVHSCGSVPPHGVDELRQPEPGLYVVGAKSYGRAPNFLLATGYEQVRSVVAELAGDHSAARQVHLVLPETGVCSLDRQPATGRRDASEPDTVVSAGISACCG